MDFTEILNAFINKTENFEVAHETMQTMIAEAPADFIHNLLQIITTTEDEKLRENATNLLTVPISRSTGSFFTVVDTSNIPDDVKSEIKQVLITMLNFDKKIADVAKRVLCFYVEFNSVEKEDLLKQLAEMIVPENAENVSVALLETIQTLCNGVYMDPTELIEIVMHFLNFFANVGPTTEDPLFPEKSKVFIKICGSFLRCIYSQDEWQEDLFNLFSFLWELTKEKFPVEGLECFRVSIPNHGLVISQIPDFAEVIFSMIQAEDADIRMAACGVLCSRAYFVSDGVYQSHNLISEGRESEIIGILINFIVSDENTNIPENDSFVRLCIIQLTSLILAAYETVSETAFQYAMVHIGSEKEPERFVAVILFTILLSHGDQDVEQIKENAQQFALASIQDPSLRVVDAGLNLMQNFFYRDLLPIDEQLVSLVAGLVCSESEEISSLALDSLFFIFSKCTPEVGDELRVEAASLIFQYISTEVPDDNKRADLLRNLTNLCKDMNPEVASTIIQPAMELTNGLIEQASDDSVPVSLSPAIGFCTSILTAAGSSDNQEIAETIQEYAGELYQLACTLVSGEFMSDGLSILSSIMKMYGSSSPEIIDFANTVVTEQLPSVSNKEDFYNLLIVAKELIPYLNQDEEKSDDPTLEMIFETCITYCNSISKNVDFLADTQRIIVDVIALVFMRSPDIVIAHMHEAFETMYPSGVRYSSVYTNNVIKFIVGCAKHFTEDPLYARALSDTLFHLGFRAISARRKSLDPNDLQTLLEAASVCDPSGITVLTSLRFIASNFDNIVVPYVTNQEKLARIKELLPEIPQKQETVQIITD